MSLSTYDAALTNPEQTALILGDGAVTFGSLAEEVRRVIGWLGERGIEAGTPRVGLLGERSREGLLLFYALVEMGVPMVLLDPRWTAAERAAALSTTGTEVVLAPADLRGTRGGEVATPAVVDHERCLAVVFTSGSGGQPKGVVLSRRAFVAAAAASAANLGWRPDDRWLLSLPLSHVGGLSILTRCLLARRTVVVQPFDRFDATRVARLIEEQRVTIVSLVPTQLARLLALPDWQPPAWLRAILLGGAAASPTLLVQAADRGWPVLATYGLTEACSQVATQRHGTVNRGELGCGEPVAGTAVRICDGVIEVLGNALMSGYLPPGGEDFTADGWLRTGDLGRLDDAGRLHVLGRRDAVIVTGGENVQPLEVEQVLEEHPAIVEACVFGVADPEWGEVVAAALVSPAPPTEAELASFLAARLAPFKRPRRVAYLEALPRRTLSKIDRRQTAEAARLRLIPFARG